MKKTKGKKRLADPDVEGLLVLADIRVAVGDPRGKLMQPDLVQRVKDIVHALGTAVVLADRGMMPGPRLLAEWRDILPEDDFDKGKIK